MTKQSTAHGAAVPKQSDFSRITYPFSSPDPFAFTLYHNLEKCPLEINEIMLKYFRLPRQYSGKALTCQCRRHKRCEFNHWAEKIPWNSKWQPTPVFFPEKL